MSRVLFAAVLFLSVPAFGAGPASRPLTPAQQIAELRSEVERLKAENAELRKQLAEAGKPAAARPKVTWTSRAKAVGGGKDELSIAADLDKRIGAYLASHKVSERVAQAMYEGKPVVGMSEDALRVIASSVHEDAESEDSKDISVIIYDFTLHTAGDTPIHRVTIREGKITSVINP